MKVSEVSEMSEVSGSTFHVSRFAFHVAGGKLWRTGTKT